MSDYEVGEWMIRTRMADPDVSQGRTELQWVGEAKRKADGPWMEDAMREKLKFDVWFETGATEAEVIAKLKLHFLQ